MKFSFQNQNSIYVDIFLEKTQTPTHLFFKGKISKEYLKGILRETLLINNYFEWKYNKDIFMDMRYFFQKGGEGIFHEEKLFFFFGK